MTIARFLPRLLLPAAVLATAGCEKMSVPSVWPFAEKEVSERDRRPANAVEYRCEQNRAFFVRRLDANTVWLIAPDREVRLAKLGGSDAERYGIGRTELELKGQVATLTDPPTTFAGCKLHEGK